MKGVSAIIDEMLLVIITISVISVSFYFYQTTIYKSGEKVGEGSEKVYCHQSSNLVILEVDGKNITVKNNGGAKLDLNKFRVYINAENMTINTIKETTGIESGILEIGETAIIILENSTSVGDVVKVVGECDTGDEIIVK